MWICCGFVSDLCPFCVRFASILCRICVRFVSVLCRICGGFWADFGRICVRFASILCLFFFISVICFNFNNKFLINHLNLLYPDYLFNKIIHVLHIYYFFIGNYIYRIIYEPQHHYSKENR